jgi:hypothetical protein
MTDYDGTALLDRRLTDEEIRELKIVLLPYFHASGSIGDEDITDFLDYTFAMISNSKPAEYVVTELIGMEMDFCNQEVAHKVGKEIANFVIALNGGGDDAAAAEAGDASQKTRVVSLKASIFVSRSRSAVHILSNLLFVAFH